MPSVETLLFRGALAPLVVLLTSIAARRFGPGLGGRLVGAPTTTAPLLLVVCMQWGPSAAAHAASGAVAGQMGGVCFAITYGRTARAASPARALTSALGAGAAGVAAATAVGGGWVAAGLVLAVAVLGLATWPQARRDDPPPRCVAWWEMPVRMALAGATVLAAVATGQVLGPHIAGVLGGLPVLLAVMAPAVRRTAGTQAAIDLALGALASQPLTVAFLLVLSAVLVPLGAVASFAMALTATIATLVFAPGRTRGPGTPDRMDP